MCGCPGLVDLLLHIISTYTLDELYADLDKVKAANADDPSFSAFYMPGKNWYAAMSFVYGAGGTTNTGPSCSGPIGTFTGALAKGIAFVDDRGKPVNAHGGGIIKEGDTFYMHGEYFLDTTTDNNFNGFSMYSSKDLATWKWEKMILPQQPSGLLEQRFLVAGLDVQRHVRNGQQRRDETHRLP